MTKHNTAVRAMSRGEPIAVLRHHISDMEVELKRLTDARDDETRQVMERDQIIADMAQQYADVVAERDSLRAETVRPKDRAPVTAADGIRARADEVES